MKSVESVERKKCGVLKVRSVESAECRLENAECGKCGV